MPGPSQPLYTYTTKTMEQVRDDILRTIANGLRQLNQNNPNIPIPNVGPNSDYYLTATGVATEIAVGLANNTLQADNVMPDTAGGSNLDRWLNLLLLGRRAATPSKGLCTPQYSASSTTIVQGAQLLDNAGLRYQVSIGGTYGTAPGLSPQVPVVAVDTGSATNHVNGDTLRWAGTPPAFVQPTVSVGTTGLQDGLTGGFDSEVGVDEPPRQRLFAAFQAPPKSGNASQIASWCAQSTPSVQQGFVYPALLGPGTVFFAVTQAPQGTPPFSSTSKNRSLPSTLISGTVVPYVQSQVPEHVFVGGASAANQPVDIAILLGLPAASTASPPGPGGGWLDGTPWPSTLGGIAVPTVGGVTSSTNFQVILPTGANGPTPGSSHISYISPNTWQLYTATVLTAVNVIGSTWTITIDTPFPDIFVGAFIFPASVNQVNYMNAALGAFGLLGPGEWSTNTSVLQRAFRHPPPFPQWPYRLDANFLRQMENAGPEVLTAQWLYAFTNSAPLSFAGVAPAPAVPTGIPAANSAGIVTSAPPNIFVPRQIGFYAQ